jgi:hypothetical protein
MIPTNLDDTKATDIQRLLDNQVEESITLDYKQELPSDGTDSRRDFLCDIAAFANARGGDLIYGISDRRDVNGKSTGLPEEIVGLSTVNISASKTRLENMIRDGITPRIDVQFKVITCEQWSVLIARIPRSWNAPHMVTYQKTNKFYTRNNTGNELMNIDQIRSSFLQKRELSDRIRAWRNHRLDLISTGNSPVKLCSPTALIIHAISADFFSEGHQLKSWRFPKESRSLLYLPAENSGAYPLYNADGFLQHSYINRGAGGFRDNGAAAYTQIFRSGAIEYLDAGVSFEHSNSGQQMMVSASKIEDCLAKCFDNVSTSASTFGVTSPAYFAVSLLNWKGTKLYIDPNSYWNETNTIQNDRFLVPEILLEPQAEEESSLSDLKPIADTIAQVCGLEASPFTAPDGRWLPFDDRRRHL